MHSKQTQTVYSIDAKTIVDIINAACFFRDRLRNELVYAVNTKQISVKDIEKTNQIINKWNDYISNIISINRNLSAGKIDIEFVLDTLINVADLSLKTNIQLSQSFS